MELRNISIILLTVMSTMFSVAVAKADTQLEVMNEAALALFTKLQKNIKGKLSYDERNRPENKGIFTSMRNMFAGDKAPQEDLEELANIYQALNYADIATISLLKEKCQEGNNAHFDPKIDPNLCGSYPKLLLSSIKGRLSAVTSHYLYYDEILKAPTDWPAHAIEMYQILGKLYPEEIFGVEMALLSSANEIYENKQRSEEPVSAPESPLAALVNSVNGQPGDNATVSSSQINQPMLSPPPQMNPDMTQGQPDASNNNNNASVITNQVTEMPQMNSAATSVEYPQTQVNQVMSQITGQPFPQTIGVQSSFSQTVPQVIVPQNANQMVPQMMMPQMNAPPAQVQILPLMIVPSTTQPQQPTQSSPTPTPTPTPTQTPPAEQQGYLNSNDNGGILNPKSVTESNPPPCKSPLISDPPVNTTPPVTLQPLTTPPEPCKSGSGSSGLDPIMKKLAGNELLVLL